MNLYIGTDKTIKNKVKGIFDNKHELINNNCYIIPYKFNMETAQKYNFRDTLDDSILYLFFQFIDSDFKNIKIFSSLKDAQIYRDDKFSYGHILGMKKDTIYESIMKCEYFSVKELN
tara:strand:- start:168 stop:518 length:351 start_codon:yes stop_codon:yes gene_type:complete